MSSFSLESFEAALTDDSATTNAFNDGYQAGYNACLATTEADSSLLSTSLVQAISDMNFTYAEARAQVLESLAPLFETLTESLLPHCVSTGFASILASELGKAADVDTNAPIRVHVHPDQQAAVAQAVATLPMQITISADQHLDLNAAWIQRGTAETHLNMDRLLAQITEALHAIAPSEDRTRSHG